MIYRYELEGKCGKDDMGQWVKYEDHLAVVEQLEYELRYLREQNMELHEEISSVLQHSPECY